MAVTEDDKKRLREHFTKGPGESIFGGAIKASASHQKRRLQRRLATANLFAEMEAEDKAELARANELWVRGENHVRSCRARKKAIAGLLDADAGLRITEEDLS